MKFNSYEESINHVQEFIKKYGVTKKWLASKAKIPYKDFSIFINGRLILPTSQYERLFDFINGFEKRMNNFV